MKTIRYINLTNGIELISSFPEGYRFLRIQSTACEQKRWDFIIADLDHDLLMNLAIGNDCVVYDCGHNGEPRALWQGLEWIKYVLNRIWFGKIIEPVLRGKKIGHFYFDEQYRNLSKPTVSKLQYYKKFLLTNEIYLRGIYDKTEHDGQYDFYREVLRNENL